MAKSDDIATKKYVTLALFKREDRLVKEIRGVEKRLDGRIDSLANDLKLLSEDLKGFKQIMAVKHDDLMNKLDAIAGMFKKDNDERTIISFRVTDHEERIQKLEKVAVAL